MPERAPALPWALPVVACLVVAAACQGGEPRALETPSSRPAPSASPPPASPTPSEQPSVFETCMTNERVIDLAGVHRVAIRVASPAPATTFDGRDATLLSYPYAAVHPFSIGKDSAPRGVCVLGGMVVGQQPRSLTWDEVKDDHDGDGLRIAGNGWYAVDGLRVDNLADGVAPRGSDGRYPADGDGFVLRNLYFTYIRDDCVENDDIGGGLIQDSLFDGCYTGISEDPSKDSPQHDHPAPAGETLTLDRVLLRLQPMPGPRGTHDPTVLGHGRLFKWSDVANTLVIRDSIFLVEQLPNSGSADFPAGTRATNVTVVWLGGGPYPGKLPASGVTVTSDRSVWDGARQRWLDRHGCESFGSCTRIHEPIPPSAADRAG